LAPGSSISHDRIIHSRIYDWKMTPLNPYRQGVSISTNTPVITKEDTSAELNNARSGIRNAYVYRPYAPGENGKITRCGRGHKAAAVSIFRSLRNAQTKHGLLATGQFILGN
jgi:hypothetical protein